MFDISRRLLVPAALLLAAARSFADYLPNLGVYELVLPAGAHYVTTPLLRPDSADLPASLRSGWQAIDAIASYDPASATWKSWFPQRRAPMDGTRQAYGPVLRIHISQPTAVAFRGTAPKDGWKAALAAAAGSSFIGPVSTTPVPLEEVVQTLEATGKFNLTRDGLFRWDIASAAWVAIDATKLAGQTLQPGTALFTNVPAAFTTAFETPDGPGVTFSDPNSSVTTYVFPSLGGDDPNSYVYKIFVEGYTGVSLGE